MTKTHVLFAVLVVLPACQGGHGSRHASEATATSRGSDKDVGIAIPIAPGKTAAWQSALEELLGPRYSEYESSRRRFGLTSQTTFLQRTPMGDFALIHMTGPDVRASFHAMSSSQDDWDVKWREMTLDLHGVDFAKGTRVFPKVEPAYSMESGATSHAKPFMFLAPLGPGGADRVRAMAYEVMGDRHGDYVRARGKLGVRREAVFLESTARGDAVVVYWLADDPVTSLERLAASSEPFDLWLRGEVEKVHPIALDTIVTIASSNTLIAEYPRP